MNIELKNIKVHKEMSEETKCFSADICLEGKKAGFVKNDGHGGCHTYYWADAKSEEIITNWANSQPTEFEFEKLDQIISLILDKNEYLQWLKRKTKKKTLFRLVGDKLGAWEIYDSPYSQKVKDLIISQHGDKIECIANENLVKAAEFY